MLRSPRARLLAVLVLLAALFGLVVWHDTLDPAPDAGAYPGSEELAADYDACLGEEVTDDVIESERSLVWRQAENRMHAQNGLLVELLG